MKNLFTNNKIAARIFLAAILLFPISLFAQYHPTEDYVNYNFAQYKSATLVNVYPNPAVAEVNLLFTSPESGVSYNIVVLSIDGKLLFAKKGNTVSGSNLIKLNVQQYIPGMYYVQLITPNSTQRVKLVKQTN